MSPKELAAAIRKGGKMITPTVTFYIPQSKSGCVLCALATGIVGSPEEMWRMRVAQCSGGYKTFVAELAGISIDTAREIEHRYMGHSIDGYESVAAWLDTLDVSKPKDAQTFDDFMKVVTQPVELETA